VVKGGRRAYVLITSVIVKYNFVFVRFILIFTLTIGGLVPCAPLEAQKTSRSSAAGPPTVLWRDSSFAATEDPLWGFGSASRAPQGPFTFVEEDTGGTQPKVTVRDRQGDSWDVKLGGEVHAERETSGEFPLNMPAGLWRLRRE
jgi:hypothetical protein